MFMSFVSVSPSFVLIFGVQMAVFHMSFWFNFCVLFISSDQDHTSAQLVLFSFVFRLLLVHAPMLSSEDLGYNIVYCFHRCLVLSFSCFLRFIALFWSVMLPGLNLSFENCHCQKCLKYGGCVSCFCA